MRVKERKKELDSKPHCWSLEQRRAKTAKTSIGTLVMAPPPGTQGWLWLTIRSWVYEVVWKGNHKNTFEPASCLVGWEAEMKNVDEKCSIAALLPVIKPAA